MNKTLEVRTYKRGTLTGKQQFPTLEHAKRYAREWVKSEIAQGEKWATAYVFGSSSSVFELYSASINRKGKLQGRAA